MKRLIALSTLLLAAAMPYAQTQPWASPPTNGEFGLIDFYPVNYLTPPGQNPTYPLSSTPEYQILARTPNPVQTTRLLDLRTFFGGEDTGCWQTAFGASGYPLTPGGAATTVAAWGSIGSQATAYRDTESASPSGTANFEFKFTAKFHAVWWIQNTNQTDWYAASPSFTERRRIAYVGSPKKISQFSQMTVRIYYVQQDALSLGAEKGYVGTQGQLTWSGSATATASVGRSESVDANGSLAPTWEPSVANFDTLASSDPRVKTVDVVLVKNMNPPGVFGWYVFEAQAPVVFQGRTQKATATATMITTKVENEPTEQQAGGVSLTDPAWASAFAKERFQVFAVRAIALTP